MGVNQFREHLIRALRDVPGVADASGIDGEDGVIGVSLDDDEMFFVEIKPA